jgi:DNA-binding transcriptional LysR family regulator
MPDHCEGPLLGRVMARLAREAPSVTLRCVRPSASEGALADANAAAELAVVPRPPALPGLLVRKLITERLRCVLRRGHPALRGGELGLADFVELRHVRVSECSLADAHVDRALSARQLQRQIGLEVHGALALGELVAGSDMIATLPEALAGALERQGLVTTAAPPFDLGAIELCLAWHERLQRDPGHVWLRQLFIDAAAQASRERRPSLAMVS